MAQVLLTAVGTAFGGPVGGFLGGIAGRLADQALVGALTPATQTGTRLTGLQLASTSVGAPMPAAFGRARVSGQVIWAANFKEARVEQGSAGGKGGGGTYFYSYSLSFAVALGEGPIDGVGRLWADGQVMDLSGVTWRLHTGAPDQAPDALIEAIEGTAPAYRGCAYLVFEDLGLDAYGNRPPQIAAEVFRRPAGAAPGLEDRLTGVNLIPGAGEFVLATVPVIRSLGVLDYASETVHAAQNRPDLLIALDALQAQLPNVKWVNLVVAWFGDDLRCGRCQVRPGVETRIKETLPLTWRVEVTRDAAHLVSTHGGGPAYGGTPSDNAVLQAIAELKSRGLSVTLYPFLMMDVAPGNGLPDPYGGAEQAAYPWRGRITGEVAPGRPGATDLTAAAAAQVAAFFGAAQAADFGSADGGVDYSGPEDDWGYRRFVLHHAQLARMAGGVEAVLVGSELRGLTTLRSGPGAYPAVSALATLAAEVKAMAGSGTQVGYSGDWSEWNVHADGTGDLRFHLDPLWASPAIDFVGVDFYPPLADWRGGDGGVDAAAFSGPHDPAYVAANVAGAEDFDWFYASDADRAAQARTPITDGGYGEPWVFRPKDLVSWWSNAHHDRPGGVRSNEATAWVPRSKPIRLIEFGCPAVDRGANAPNLFVDPKSAESSLPPFSTGARDDLGQRVALEGVLAHFADPAGNPVSDVYGGPMLQGLDAWCWDARPYPDFPARTDVWSDGPDWTLGHWLTGRAGGGSAAALAGAVLARASLGAGLADATEVAGSIAGYVVAQPMSVADALQPLGMACAFDPAERGGVAQLVPRDGAPALTLALAEMALADDGPADPRDLSRTLSPTPDLVRVAFIDADDAYQAGSTLVRAATPGGGGPDAVSVEVVMDAGQADAVARRRLARALAEQDALTVRVGPLAALQAEPGDLVTVEGVEGVWRVLRCDQDETPRLSLSRAEDPVVVTPPDLSAIRLDPPPPPDAPPALLMLDLPPLDGQEDDVRPLAAVASRPARAFDVSAGPDDGSLSVRAAATEPATLGATVSDLPPGPLWRWDRATVLNVRVDAGALQSASEAQVLGGANTLAVLRPDGSVELLQFASALALGGGAYALSDLLRGQLGTEAAGTVPAGAPFVLVDADLARAQVGSSERGLPLVWRAAPSGGPPAGLAMTETGFTWRGVAYRPFSPTHLSAARSGGDVSLAWIRRARVHGDGWDGGDVPLGEETESYLVEVLGAGGAGVRSWTVGAPQALYAAADLAADFGTMPATLTVRVSQLSAIWGWGAPTQRTLWL